MSEITEKQKIEKKVDKIFEEQRLQKQMEKEQKERGAN